MLIPLLERAKNTRDLYLKVTHLLLSTTLKPFLTLKYNSATSTLTYPWVTIFHVFDLLKPQQGTLLLQLCPLVLQLPISPFPPLMSLSWSVLAQWRVSSNLSCPSKRNQDELAGALGHQPLCYLNPQHLRLHNGRQVLRKSRGDGKKAIYSQGIQERKAHKDPATKGRRAALIMTIP